LISQTLAVSLSILLPMLLSLLLAMVLALANVFTMSLTIILAITRPLNFGRNIDIEFKLLALPLYIIIYLSFGKPLVKL
jgi:hypothetical protein